MPSKFDCISLKKRDLTDIDVQNVNRKAGDLISMVNNKNHEGTEESFKEHRKKDSVTQNEVSDQKNDITQEQNVAQAESDSVKQEKEQDKEQQENETKKKIQWFHINRKYLSICRYALFVIIAAIIIYIVISHWSETTTFVANFIDVLSPFLIGVLIAYFLIPLVARIQGILQKYVTKGRYEKITKVVSILISYVVVLGFIAVAFVFVIPQMGQSVQELTEKIPGTYKQIMQELDTLQKKYPDIDFELVSEQFGKAVPNLISYGTNLMGNLIPVVYSVSMSILKTAINIILGLIISIYMIYSKDKFRFQAKRVVYAVFPEEKGDVLCSTLRECNDIFGAFLISKAIDSLIIGCICCVAMNIIGLPYAVLLSVIVGITNMIPYFGPFIGAVPGVLIFLCTDWELAIVFAIMILIIQQFDGLILGPRLLGQSTGLSPIWVIFAITVGGAYFGVIGMFIGVPVVAVVAYLINKLINSRLAGKDIQALKNVKKSNNS